MKRRLYEEEHEFFRDTFRKFIKEEIAPHYESWEKQGHVPREIYLQAGAQGFLCPTADEKYGGAGADFRYAAIVAEELYFHSFPGSSSRFTAILFFLTWRTLPMRSKWPSGHLVASVVSMCWPLP